MKSGKKSVGSDLTKKEGTFYEKLPKGTWVNIEVVDGTYITGRFGEVNSKYIILESMLISKSTVKGEECVEKVGPACYTLDKIVGTRILGEDEVQTIIRDNQPFLPLYGKIVEVSYSQNQHPAFGRVSKVFRNRIELNPHIGYSDDTNNPSFGIVNEPAIVSTGSIRCITPIKSLDIILMGLCEEHGLCAYQNKDHQVQ